MKLIFWNRKPLISVSFYAFERERQWNNMIEISCWPERAKWNVTIQLFSISNVWTMIFISFLLPRLRCAKMIRKKLGMFLIPFQNSNGFLLKLVYVK